MPRIFASNTIVESYCEFFFPFGFLLLPALVSLIYIHSLTYSFTHSLIHLHSSNSELESSWVMKCVILRKKKKIYVDHGLNILYRQQELF